MRGAREGSWAAGLSTQSALPKGAIGACKRLQKAARGGSRAVFESTRSKGGGPELVRASGAAHCCLSSPPALPTCVLILILHLPFALL